MTTKKHKIKTKDGFIEATLTELEKLYHELEDALADIKHLIDKADSYNCFGSNRGLTEKNIRKLLGYIDNLIKVVIPIPSVVGIVEDVLNIIDPSWSKKTAKHLEQFEMFKDCWAEVEQELTDVMREIQKAFKELNN